MKTVELAWTPSVSPGVDSQTARIVDVNTQQIYGEQTLAPASSMFKTECPEGSSVIGVVETVRDGLGVSAVSDTLSVGYGPLQPATGLVIGIPVIQQPIS